MKTLTASVLTLVAALAGTAYTLHHPSARHLHAHGHTPTATDSDAPLVLVTHATPKEGRAEALLAELARMAELTTEEPGVLHWQLLDAQREGGPITTIVAWESTAAFENFHASPAFRAYHESGDAERVHALAEEFRYETYDHVDGWSRRNEELHRHLMEQAQDAAR